MIDSARTQRALTTISRPAVLLWLIAAWFLTSLYCHNDNTNKVGGDPGDGVYRPQLARGDGHTTYLMMRSIAIDGDLDFENELQRFGDPWNQKRTDTGKKGIANPVGPALVWLPFFGAAHAAAKVANLFGAEIASHGYTMFHQRVVFFSSVLGAILAVLLALVVVRRKTGIWAPTYGGLAVLFATSLTFYATYQPSYAHALDAGIVAIFLAYWALRFGNPGLHRFVVLGALLGVCALIRVTNFLCGLAVAVEVAWLLVKDLRARDPEALRAGLRRAALGLVTLVVAIAVFGVQLLVWKSVYGEYITSPNGEGYVDLGRSNVAAFLWSSRHGWFALHPVAYIGVLGLLFAPRAQRPLAVGLLMVVAAQVYVNSCVWDWWGMASFGARRVTSMALPCAVGLAWLAWRIAHLQRWIPRPLLHAVALCGVAWFATWNLSLMKPLAGGARPPGHDRAKSRCCKELPDFMADLAEPIYERIGNPFAMPASLAFVLSHGGRYEQWDGVVGNYADRVSLKMFNEKRHLRRKFAWNIPGVHFDPYILTGFGPRQHQRNPKRNFRWTTREDARFLLPLFLDGARELSLPLRPNILPSDPPVRVQVEVNGVTCFDGDLEYGWSTVRMDVDADDIGRGLNEIAIRAPVAAYRKGDTADAWLPPLWDGRLMGLAVGQLNIRFPRPRKR